MAGHHVSWRIAVIIGTALVLIATAAVNLAYGFGSRTRDMKERVRERVVSGEYMENMADRDMGCLEKPHHHEHSPMPMDVDYIMDNMPWSQQGPFVTLLAPPDWLMAAMLIVNILFPLAWIVYGHTTLCRHTTAGSCSYLYYDPEFIPWLTYVLFAVAMILSVLENYIIAYLLLWVGAIINLVRAVVAAGALWKAIVGLDKSTPALKLAGRASEIGWAVGLVHNGLGFYGAWVLLLFHIRLAGTLVYFCGVAMNTACYIVLAIALLFIILLAWVENFHAYEKLKYLYGTHIAWIISFIGLLSRNWDSECGVIIFMLIVFIVLVLAFFIKLCVFCCRNRDKQEVKEQLGMQRAPVGYVNQAMPPAIIKAPGPALGQGVVIAAPPQPTSVMIGAPPQPTSVMMGTPNNVIIGAPNNAVVYNYAP